MESELKQRIDQILRILDSLDASYFINITIPAPIEIDSNVSEAFFSIKGSENRLVSDMVQALREEPLIEIVLKRALALHIQEQIEAGWAIKKAKEKGKVN